jgi:hypothetical protein
MPDRGGGAACGPVDGTGDDRDGHIDVPAPGDTGPVQLDGDVATCVDGTTDSIRSTRTTHGSLNNR